MSANVNDENLIAVLGQQIRIDIRWGTGVPLVLCNGIGASLEVLDPFVAQLDPSTTVVRFDVPGSGGSPDSLFLYRFPYLATVLSALLKKVGILNRHAGGTQVDILGLSWGGALAQQFAFPEPAQMPQAHPGIDRYRFGDDSREAGCTGEDVDAAQVSGSPLCRPDRS
jgi:pimeloyl-ACP methyl ester carboxylesterase